MLKIKKDVSAFLSLILAYLALGVIGIVAAVVPFFHQFLYDNIFTEVPGDGTMIGFVIFCYLVLITAAVADVLLIRLLGNVRRSEIFTASAVAKLRSISWCCFAECLILMGGSIVFFRIFVFPHAMLIFAFAAAFLGIVLRVVKNVIEEAVAIKYENDYTI